MKLFKKLFSIALSCAVILSLSACSDLTWVAKDGEGNVIPIGSYIYFSYSSYDSNISNIDTSKKLTDQKIEDKTIAETIRENAIENVKYLLELERRFKAEGMEIPAETIALIEDEKSQDTTMAGAVYAANKELYTKLGISKESVVMASSSGGFAAIKEEMLFMDQYGPEGKTPITEDELTKYFQDNNIYISYISAPIVDTENTSSTEIDPELQTQVKAEFDKIIEDCKNGVRNLEDVITEYSEKGTEYEGMSRQVYPKEGGTDLLSKVAALADNEYTYLEESGRAFLFLKHPVAESKYLENEDNKENLLYQYKMEEFRTNMLNSANANKSVVFNEQAIKKYSIEKLNIEGQK